jgi:hypothetical protein
MPNIPVIIEKPTSLEASLPVPPRKPHNVARKGTVKKLMITETTSQEVSVGHTPRVLMQGRKKTNSY